MTRARYRGNLVDNFVVGTVFGEAMDGAKVKVVAVEYDPDSDMTTITGHKTAAAAPDGQRIRYHGDAADSGDLPDMRTPLTDPIEPR